LVPAECKGVEKKGETMQLQEAIRSRRSIRQFLSKPVEEDVIQELIARVAVP